MMTREFRFAIESVQGRRPQNQDAVVAERVSEDVLLLAVADGRGEAGVGEVGSALALQTLSEAIRGGRGLEEAVRHSNARVFERRSASGAAGMASTLTALLLDRNRFLLASVGDSRAYRITREGIRSLTVDHTTPAQEGDGFQPGVGSGATPWEESLTRSIGTAAAVEVDVFGPFSADDEAGILLCTDGLHKILGPREIWTICLDAEGPQEAADALVSAAYDRGSADNITVALAYLGASPRVGPGNGPSGPEAPSERDRPLAGFEADSGKSGARPGESPELGPESAPGGEERAVAGPLRIPVPPWEISSRGRRVVVGGPKGKRKKRASRSAPLALLAALLLITVTLVILHAKGFLL